MQRSAPRPAGSAAGGPGRCCRPTTSGRSPCRGAISSAMRPHEGDIDHRRGGVGRALQPDQPHGPGGAGRLGGGADRALRQAVGEVERLHAEAGHDACSAGVGAAVDRQAVQHRVAGLQDAPERGWRSPPCRCRSRPRPRPGPAPPAAPRPCRGWGGRGARRCGPRRRRRPGRGPSKKTRWASLACWAERIDEGRGQVERRLGRAHGARPDRSRGRRRGCPDAASRRLSPRDMPALQIVPAALAQYQSVKRMVSASASAQ